jgi:SiaC family regulatory phosphoprotein
MHNLNLAPTKTTPTIVFDAERNILEFSGQSYPENAMQFYQGILQNLADYLAANSGPFTVNFKLDYFNTSSSKCLLDLLECLDRSHQRNNNITVNWYYSEGDEDMHDSGADFSMDVKLPFHLIAHKP